MFDNLKIAITDEVQLKAVCDVLESVGYKNTYKTASKVTTVITDKTTYSLLGLPCEIINDSGCNTTLTDLLAMRDKQFMEKLKTMDQSLISKVKIYHKLMYSHGHSLAQTYPKLVNNKECQAKQEVV